MGKENYVDKKDFLDLLKRRKTEKDPKKQKIIWEKIGRIFYSIAVNYTNRTKFINYTTDRKDEMISDATFYMVKYVDNYDIDRKNPFAYFTTAAHHAFLQNIKKYKKYSNTHSSFSMLENTELI
jgi:DNA-directed RNA polymerase specialized sigma subunit